MSGQTVCRERIGLPAPELDQQIVDTTNIKLKLHTCHSNIGTCVRRIFFRYLHIWAYLGVYRSF